MKEEVIASRYGEALFALGKKGNNLEELGDNLYSIQDLFSQYPELQKFYYHPIVSSRDKKNTMEKILSDKVHANILNFVKLLVDKKRENFLPNIIKHYKILSDKHFKRSTAEIITAIELDGPTANMLQQKIQNYLNQDILPEFKVDKDILGGVIVKVGDRMLDASLSGQLERLTHSLI